MSNISSDDDQRNNRNLQNQRFEAEDGSNGIQKGRKFNRVCYINILESKII